MRSWRAARDTFAASGGKLEAAGARALSERAALTLGRDIIHSVTNPIERLSGAVHVYAGDFFRTERSEWDPESLLERRYDVERALRLFTDEPARAASSGA
jgi:predicted metal-dependent enzyme (double-stranded beta helix superfamily)